MFLWGQIWDLRQATKDTRGTKPIKIYSAPSPIACVAFDNDQKQLAAACGKTIQLYDLTTGKVCDTVEARTPVVGFTHLMHRSRPCDSSRKSTRWHTLPHKTSAF